MSVELSNKNPGKANNHDTKAINKLLAKKKRCRTNLVVEEKQKDKHPLFYTKPIFKPNKYEFY